MRALEVCLQMKYEYASDYKGHGVHENERLEERWLVYVWRPPETIERDPLPHYEILVPRLWAQSYECYEEAVAAFNTIRGFVASMKRHEVVWSLDPNKNLYQSLKGKVIEK